MGLKCFKADTIDYEFDCQDDQWMSVNTYGSSNLPQHCTNDCPCQQTSKAQVQSEKASCNGYSHTSQNYLDNDSF